MNSYINGKLIYIEVIITQVNTYFLSNDSNFMMIFLRRFQIDSFIIDFARLDYF